MYLPSESTGPGRRYALSLHDVKVSGGEATVAKIRTVIDRYRVPLAVHLVFDEELESSSPLARFLSRKMEEGALEIVFHGLTHRCPENVGRLISFYHKYQAEYLLDTEKLRDKTREMYQEVTAFTGTDTGICPPCWIACRNNRKFLRRLNPVFVESLFSMDFSGHSFFSPVISLGSIKGSELVFLKTGARLMYLVSLLSRKTRLRVAVHECDLELESSLEFFSGMFKSLNAKGFKPVLMRGLF
ncbi:MAG TPA: hypothetical protein PK514_04235 [Spirochaetota bacterium]|nr:hypothetical protein [Spirochaetota bacterium]